MLINTPVEKYTLNSRDKIKAKKAIEADMKHELNVFKTAEGDALKDAAKKQLKRLTALKKEAEAEIKTLEGDII